jgi:hypothetical protein
MSAVLALSLTACSDPGKLNALTLISYLYVETARIKPYLVSIGIVLKNVDGQEDLENIMVNETGERMALCRFAFLHMCCFLL